MTTTKSKNSSIDHIIEIIGTLSIEDKVKLCQWLEQEITASKQPWLKTVGIFKQDCQFDDVQQFIHEYRQEIDEIEE
ncbi:hypothetical protein PCC8801_2335 [Rippkaea orientalis PCC 8801]|uniref:Uncharacterized protein n=1 Tax=Rippkaea orientalis (strain PCC 8801 / RF-1) TaxID=41431 RepID=B7K2F8_RIPO1|nr:hypothetical protein [Rippkaea orientalis]ACK66351.1 hypothetical protein PCC8801_2335 [Rippkaea orientalis PCC 8801]